MLGWCSSSSLQVKVSLPQLLMVPMQKNGRPADIVTLKTGLGLSNLQKNCVDASSSLFSKSEPSGLSVFSSSLQNL